MTNHLKKANFKLEGKQASNASAHAVYSNVLYADGKNKKYFVKEASKGADAAINEVAFSNLAKLFMRPGLTPDQHLVHGDTNAIWAVASLSMANVIDENFDGRRSAPVFLNELPHGHFAELLEKRKSKEITIDMDSLASCLSTSYFLEEDDLHKGNIGYYVIVGENQIPKLVFFKIDHDLMLSDSIMSHGHARTANIHYDDKSFAITTRDLVGFPNLIDSGNHYWPTQKRLLVPLGADKVYENEDEINAFKSLQHDGDFKQAQWRQMLQHALMPSELIVAALSQGLDPNNSQDKARIDTITQAVYERQQKLLVNLFACPEFREAYNKNHEQWKKSIKEQLNANLYLIEDGTKRVNLINNFEEAFNEIYLQQGTIKTGDSPLHVAIRLERYRFKESIKAFRQLINQPNSEGEKPIDIARNKHYAARIINNPSKDQDAVIHSLIHYGADKGHSDSHGKAYQSHHIPKARTLLSADEIKQQISAISADVFLEPKMKKKVALELISQSAKNLSRHELNQLKRDLEHDPAYQFTRQLTSRLWIVRIIRGLYGKTSTYDKIHQVLQAAIDNAPPVQEELISKKNHSPVHDSDGPITRYRPWYDSFFSAKPEDKEGEQPRHSDTYSKRN